MDSLNASFGYVEVILLVYLFHQHNTKIQVFATMSRAEVAKFNAQLRMAEGSLQKAPLLNLFDSNDQLSVGFRLKTFFNSVIRDSKGGMGSVKTLQDRFRDYYENFIQAEIDSKKTARGKKNILLQEITI